MSNNGIILQNQPGWICHSLTSTITDVVVESQHCMMSITVQTDLPLLLTETSLFHSTVFTFLLSIVYFPQVYQIDFKSGLVEETKSILLPNIDNHHSVSSTKKEQNKDLAEEVWMRSCGRIGVKGR